MREVYEIHDAEHEREPGRHQKERDPELHAVQQLLETRIQDIKKKGRSCALSFDGV